MNKSNNDNDLSVLEGLGLDAFLGTIKNDGIYEVAEIEVPEDMRGETIKFSRIKKLGETNG